MRPRPRKGAKFQKQSFWGGLAESPNSLAPQKNREAVLMSLLRRRARPGLPKRGRTGFIPVHTLPDRHVLTPGPLPERPSQGVG